MALILRSTIPRALMQIPQKKAVVIPLDVYETYCTNILISGENKPFVSSATNKTDGKLEIEYTTQNINELVEKMHATTATSEARCCGECGSC